jgi:hypothetical protein
MMLFLILRLGRRLVHGDMAGIRAVLAGVQDWRARRSDAPRLKPSPGNGTAS